MVWVDIIVAAAVPLIVLARSVFFSGVRCWLMPSLMWVVISFIRFGQSSVLLVVCGRLFGL